MARFIRSPLFLMALTVFIDFTGFGLVLPLLPFWAERLGANAFGVGLVVTVFAVAQFLFTPLLGALSDRYGRRPIILVSLVIEALSLAGTGLAFSLPALLAARFVGGLGASNIGSAQAVVADVTSPKDRAKGMGAIGAAIGLGFVVGPALGGLLAGSGPAVPFFVAAIVALLNAVLVWRFLPETRVARAGAPEHAFHMPRVTLLLSGWQRVLRSPAVARLVVINLLFTLAFTAMETVYPLLAQHLFGWGAPQIGLLFTYVGAVVVITQGGLVGQLVKRLGERGLLLIGLVLLAGGLILIPFSTTLALVLVSMGLVSLGDGAVSPTTTALLSLASPADAQGETLGVAQGVGGLGRVAGPLAAGTLYAAVGPATPFVAGGVLVVLALLIALPGLTLVRRQNAPTAASADDTAREPVQAR